MTTAQRGRPNNQSINTGRVSELWRMVDALRGSMNCRVQNVVLGLIFLKYISGELWVVKTKRFVHRRKR